MHCYRDSLEALNLLPADWMHTQVLEDEARFAMHALAGVCRDTTQVRFRVTITMNETPGDRPGTQNST